MRIRGFTLIEMMAALSIAAILMGVGVPSFRSLIQNWRITAATNDFLAAILLARSEAMQRGTRVDLVPADGMDWRRGWVVFIDDNGNQLPEIGEEVILSHGPVADDILIMSSFTDSSRKYLSYNGAGRSRTNTSNFSSQLGTISFTLGSHVRRIKINFLGRARSCNPDADRTCTGILDGK